MASLAALPQRPLDLIIIIARLSVSGNTVQRPETATSRFKGIPLVSDPAEPSRPFRTVTQIRRDVRRPPVVALPVKTRHFCQIATYPRNYLKCARGCYPQFHDISISGYLNIFNKPYQGMILFMKFIGRPML